MVAYPHDTSTWEAEAGGCHEAEASLSYVMSSKPVWLTQLKFYLERRVKKTKEKQNVELSMLKIIQQSRKRKL